MVSFAEYVKQSKGIEMPHGEIPSSWFYKNGFPMVVRCCCCDMTMASPSAWIDEEGYTYCGTCCEIEEK